MLLGLRSCRWARGDVEFTLLVNPCHGQGLISSSHTIVFKEEEASSSS